MVSVAAAGDHQTVYDKTETAPVDPVGDSKGRHWKGQVGKVKLCSWGRINVKEAQDTNL